jgi:hypothetical protein
VSEKEREFLDRIGQILEEDPDPQINALDVDRIYKTCLRWRKLETEAAKYVESVICLRSNRFTGNQPYVGWKGLGLALREDYDELECAKAERDEADRRSGAAERTLDALSNVCACLLDSYLCTFEGNYDALAHEAERLIPDWKLRSSRHVPKGDAGAR